MATLIITASTAAVLYGLYWLFIGAGSWKYYDSKCLPFLRFCIRLFFRHIIMVFQVAFGVIVGYLVCLGAVAGAAKLSAPLPANLGGREEEKFFRFMNVVTAPVQLMVEGLLTIAACLVLVLAVFLNHFFTWAEANPTPIILLFVILYCLWLRRNAKRIWDDEFEVGCVETPSKYAPAGVEPCSLEEGGYFFQKD